MIELSKKVQGKIVKNKPSNLLKVFVAGGSLEVSSFYYRDAYKIGRLLAELKVGYGQGGNTQKNTIMGESFRGYKEAGGLETSFLVENIYYDKAMNDMVDSLFIIDSAFDLTKAEYLWADIVLILPGGHGTLNEITSLVERKRESGKGPEIIIYNQHIDGRCFFDGYIEIVNDMKKEKFIDEDKITKEFKIATTIIDLEKIIRMDVERLKNEKNSII